MLVIGGLTLNIVSAYAPQVGLKEEVKKCYWEDLDEVVRGIPHFVKLFIDRDFNASELVIANLCFSKEVHLVTFCSTMARTRIDYLLLWKGDEGLCKDCKVISSENLTTQHKLLMMDLGIRREGKKTLYDRPRIKWGGLTPVRAWEMGEKLEVMEAWGSSGDADNIWDKIASCIREEAREMYFGVCYSQRTKY
ncbi:hypothetical protein R3W88_005065 [Solanum pinnatisectum]|uniref:Uncharacterized protein n=1 Tax=Solanum pinnatisectum TaxID=50273 RepID=A0AAV9KBH5_9SOLN|nr:hypothetical protein R3W88_005065 [Solanum pinnatisectum]